MITKTGIYKITNTANGKIYIGSAFNLSNRISVHKYTLKNNKHKNLHLQYAYNLYGEDSFTFEIVEIVNDKTILLEREQCYLDSMKPYDRTVGYNIAKIAGNTAGRKASQEARKKMSEAAKKRPKRILSEQHKQRLRERFSGVGHKIDWDTVKEIRKLYQESSNTQKQIAEKFGLAQTTVSEIIRNVIWVDKDYSYSRKRNKNNKP